MHIHGASVGETLSALPVIEKIHRLHPDIRFIVTSGTKASGLLLEKKLPPYAKHYFAPMDTPQILDRFFKYITPNMTIIIDSEIWPNFLLQAKKRNIAVFALNMRFSERSRKRWLLFKNDFKKIMGAYEGFFVQNDTTAHFIRQVSNKTMRICNNLKWGQAPEHVADTVLQSYREKIGCKAVILLASTHDDEELQLNKALMAQNLDAKIIIMPRHPDRGKSIQTTLSEHNIISELRSENGTFESDNIYIADTIGEMALWARLSDIVIMGKTFDAIGGGHNIIESSLYKNTIICGPKMHNFKEILSLFLKHNAIITVNSPEECALQINDLLGNPKNMQEYCQNAHDLYEKNHNKALSFLHDLTPYLLHKKNEEQNEST